MEMLSLMAKEVTDAEIGTVGRRWKITEAVEKKKRQPRKSRGSKGNELM